jgi:hypothetical protein
VPAVGVSVADEEQEHTPSIFPASVAGLRDLRG